MQIGFELNDFANTRVGIGLYDIPPMVSYVLGRTQFCDVEQYVLMVVRTRPERRALLAGEL
jgi:hypothetical protein